MAGSTASEISVVASLLFAMMEDKNLDFLLLVIPIIFDKDTLIKWVGIKPEAVKAYREAQEKNILAIRKKIEQYEKPVVICGSGGAPATPRPLSFSVKAGSSFAPTHAAPQRY